MNEGYISELKNILSSDSSDELKKQAILQYHDKDIARLFERSDKQGRLRLYDILGEKNIARALTYVDDLEDLLEELGVGAIAGLLEYMTADHAILVLKQLDDDRRMEVISLLSRSVREAIYRIKEYDEDCIGSRMTNNYITILNTDTIKTATRKVLAATAEYSNVSYIYVLNAGGVFYGVVKLKDLIAAKPADELEGLIKKKYPRLYAEDSIENCLVKCKAYSIKAYPVLDKESRLVGIITSEEIVKLMEKETKDDFMKFAGLTEKERLKDSVFESVKRRIPWLVVLLVLGLFQAFAMTAFEHIISIIPVIVFFETLVLCMSGTSATQSLAVTVEHLSNREDGHKQISKILIKELKTGLVNGLAISIMAFIIAFFFMFVTKQSIGTDGYHVQDAIKASGIIALSLWAAMTLSSCLGALVPAGLLKIHVDPALATSSFIRLLSDVIALLIYYGLAYLLFLAF